MNKTIKASLSFFLSIFIPLAAVCFINLNEDPFFHYKAPQENCYYKLDNQRYQNYGLITHLSYQGIIIGSSMTENFDTDYVSKVWGLPFFRASATGGYLLEDNRNLKRALETHPDLKEVIWGLDSIRFILPFDSDAEDYIFPYYLYDNNPFNDFPYFLNKTILFNYTFRNIYSRRVEPPQLDIARFRNWNRWYPFGKEAVLSQYSPPSIKLNKNQKEAWEKNIENNINHNILPLIKAHPKTNFNLFIPPYSFLYFHRSKMQDTLDIQVKIQQKLIEALLPLENVRFFSFYTDTKSIEDLNNYKDEQHYSEKINEKIAKAMYKGDFQITKENAQEYIKTFDTYIHNLDFSEYFPENTKTPK